MILNDLNEKVVKLCEDLTTIKNARWEHCAERGAYYDFKAGQKYIKIISYDDSSKGGASVWGFVNKSNPNFAVGDILKASGRSAPALNRPRGNVLDGYEVLGNDRLMYGPGYISGYSAGGYRNGSLV